MGEDAVANGGLSMGVVDGRVRGLVQGMEGEKLLDERGGRCMGVHNHGEGVLWVMVDVQGGGRG